MFIFTTKQFTLENIDDTLARKLALHKEFLAMDTEKPIWIMKQKPKFVIQSRIDELGGGGGGRR